MKIKTQQYNVFFVDDDPGVRSAVVDALKDLGCKVTCFANAFDCLEHLSRQICNMLITEVNLRGMDGVNVLSEVKRVTPWISVMLITGFGNVPMSVRALKLGAVDFIEKPLERKIFLHKVKTILQQDDFADIPIGQALTKIQKKILKLILDGEGNKQMAHKLQRALRTVERHRSSIMHKFGVDNVVSLVKKAGLINLDLDDVALVKRK